MRKGGEKMKKSKLKTARVAKGLSQDELAKLAGVSRTAVIGLENDPTKAKAKTLFAVAKALGIPAESIFMP